MLLHEMAPDDELTHDEDVKFERDKESEIVPLTEAGTAGSSEAPAGQTTIPSKEETLGKSDFPPLSEADKQAKLDEKLEPKTPEP